MYQNTAMHRLAKYQGDYYYSIMVFVSLNTQLNEMFNSEIQKSIHANEVMLIISIIMIMIQEG